jgi:4-hydroxy-3-polyprenylbenzoate decarboxylase
MEGARAIWETLGLPALAVRPPWHGYTLGDWTDVWERFAQRAARGEWERNGIETLARSRGGLAPETPVGQVEKSAEE